MVFKVEPEVRIAGRHLVTLVSRIHDGVDGFFWELGKGLFISWEMGKGDIIFWEMGNE